MPRVYDRVKRRLSSTPRFDEGSVGITFVDVLFAIVAGELLRPLAKWWTISDAGAWHLAVAATLVLTSWIGYHTSSSRPRFVIRFPNLPLMGFVVIAAFIAGTSILVGDHPSALTVTVFDALLIVLLLAFRVAKEAAEPPVAESPNHPVPENHGAGPMA